ncbi:MAG: hypothetical protein M3P10_03965, partial [Actinomycetota bacterium]|nr:hypothetical protein [Actinomycetota bacterium]
MANGAHSSTPKKRVGVAKIAIAVVVIAAIVVGGNLLFGGGGGGLDDSSPPPVDPATPTFDFKVAKAVVVTVSVDQSRK